MRRRLSLWWRPLHARVEHAVAATAVLGGMLTLPGVAGASIDPGADLKTCFWSDVVRTEGKNILVPDAAATYWYTRFVLPPGGKVVLRGDFPHARSFFLWHYDLVTPRDGLNDRGIVPDPGSSNPFLPGADRTVARRSFRVTVSGQAPPRAGQPRAANTIYVGRGGATSLPRAVQLIYRVYLPDDGRPATGGVGLADAEYVSAQGRTYTGPAACSILANAGARFPNLPPLATPAYLALLRLSPKPSHPAVAPTKWYGFFNDARLTEPLLTGTPAEALIPALPTGKESLAVRPEADSGLLYTYVDRSLGPDPNGHNVLVLRGTLPTTPRTFHGEGTLAARPQVRYWSLCKYDSFVLGRGGDCLYDEEVPVDAAGRFTIVASLPEDRPANATAGCGIAWMDYGRTGDGLMRPRGGLLVLRNQLPDPAFATTPANIDQPGTEAAVMGSYQPRGDYLTRAEFEQSGCANRARVSRRRSAAPSGMPGAATTVTR